MIFDTNDYSAQEVQLLLCEIERLEKLKTKSQYAHTHKSEITRQGLDKRLKSIKSPQKYYLCGVVIIADK